jgi:flagellar biosynthesis/type III secretory pathway protein FliH
VEDSELKPGDVVVESRNGIFDGRLSMRLSQLAEALARPPVDDSKEK